MRPCAYHSTRGLATGDLALVHVRGHALAHRGIWQTADARTHVVVPAAALNLTSNAVVRLAFTATGARAYRLVMNWTIFRRVAASGNLPVPAPILSSR